MKSELIKYQKYTSLSWKIDQTLFMKFGIIN